MSLINYQVELKLRWVKHFLLSVAANNNDEANLDNIISRSKAQNYYPQPSLYQQMATKNYQNFLAKDLKDQFIGMSVKQNVRIKMRKVCRC